MLAYESSKTNCVATIDSILARGIRVASLSIIHFQECKLAPQACVFSASDGPLEPNFTQIPLRDLEGSPRGPPDANN